MANRNFLGVNHDIRSNSGRYIQMPVWHAGEPESTWGKLAIPNPHANSSVGDTSQLYPHGTKFVDGDRTFYYGYMNTVYTGNKANLGCFNLNEQDTFTWGATAGVAGDTKVGILASTLDVDTTPAEDFFAGGWMMPRTNPYSSYRVIKSSLVDNTVVGEVDLWLDHGLVEAVTASQASCFLNRSEWTKLAQHWAGGINYATCPGVTLIDPIAGTWQWLQTWGPCYVVPYNEEIGAVALAHTCFFHIDGTIRLITLTPTASQQIAGYMYPSSGSGFGSTWLIRLQISP